MDNNLPKKVMGQVCPMCGETTLQSQFEVVWCSNLRNADDRSCQFGLGTGEKTFDDLKDRAA